MFIGPRPHLPQIVPSFVENRSAALGRRSCFCSLHQTAHQLGVAGGVLQREAGDEQREEQLAVTDEVLDGLDCADIPRLTVYNKCDKPGALSFDPDILLTSAKTGYGLDTLLQKLDELLSDRVHTIRVLLPYDKLGLAAPMRERGSVQVEEYREDGLYLEGIVKTEDLHCFEGDLV